MPKTRFARPHLPLALASLAAAGSAFAHPGHEAASLMSGFAHPFAGLDHLLAMVAVGLFAARQAGAARRLVPAGFVLAMLAGAALSAGGVALPAVEAGVAASVLALGLLVALLARLPLAGSLPLVATFALFHGHAHHAEIADASTLGYMLGVAAATLLLQAALLTLAHRLPDTRAGRGLTRFAGALIAGAGAVLLGA